MSDLDGAGRDPASDETVDPMTTGGEEQVLVESEPSPTLLQPVRENERIASLDVLRGVAILGIFFVNMQLFAMPFASMLGLDLADKPQSELWAWAFVRTFFEYKFISMFSLLFGAGLIMQMMRAEQAERPFIPFFLRRLFVLGLFGVVHFTLLWYGDILFVYAWIGVLMMFLRGLAPKTLLKVAGVALAIAIVVGTGCGLMQTLGPGVPGETQPEPAAQVDSSEDDAVAAAPVENASESESEEAEDDGPQRGIDAMTAAKFQPFIEPWINGETYAYRDGPFVDALLFRLVSYMFAFMSAFFGYGWHVLAMFCIGAALMKVDFFRPHRIAWHKKMMIWGLAIGLPIEAGVSLLHHINDHEMNFLMLAANVIREVGSVALCLGYVGLICTLCSLGIGRIAFRGIANVGRMALSTYLLSTVSATFFMYWWGLGWFDSVSRVEQCLLVVAIYVVLMIFATLWLIPFRMGPFEWLWRTLSYMKPQRLLRDPATN